MARIITTLVGLAGLLTVASCAEQEDAAVRVCQRVLAFSLNDGQISSRTKAKALCAPIAAYRCGAQIVGYVKEKLQAG